MIGFPRANPPAIALPEILSPDDFAGQPDALARADDQEHRRDIRWTQQSDRFCAEPHREFQRRYGADEPASFLGRDARSAALCRPETSIASRLQGLSQHDEDGIIQEIFRRIGTSARTFVEFGVESGVECNTVKLLVEGWRGLWIEANAQACNGIKANFEAFLKEKRLTLTQSLVTAENINGLIEKGGLKGEIDILSIDIDFNDYWVWKAIDRQSARCGDRIQCRIAAADVAHCCLPAEPCG